MKHSYIKPPSPNDFPRGEKELYLFPHLSLNAAKPTEFKRALREVDPMTFEVWERVDSKLKSSAASDLAGERSILPLQDLSPTICYLPETIHAVSYASLRKPVPMGWGLDPLERGASFDRGLDKLFLRLKPRDVQGYAKLLDAVARRQQPIRNDLFYRMYHLQHGLPEITKECLFGGYNPNPTDYFEAVGSIMSIHAKTFIFSRSLYKSVDLQSDLVKFHKHINTLYQEHLLHPPQRLDGKQRSVNIQYTKPEFAKRLLLSEMAINLANRVVSAKQDGPCVGDEERDWYDAVVTALLIQEHNLLIDILLEDSGLYAENESFSSGSMA